MLLITTAWWLQLHLNAAQSRQKVDLSKALLKTTLPPTQWFLSPANVHRKTGRHFDSFIRESHLRTGRQKLLAVSLHSLGQKNPHFCPVFGGELCPVTCPDLSVGGATVRGVQIQRRRPLSSWLVARLKISSTLGPVKGVGSTGHAARADAEGLRVRVNLTVHGRRPEAELLHKGL